MNSARMSRDQASGHPTAMPVGLVHLPRPDPDRRRTVGHNHRFQTGAILLAAVETQTSDGPS